MPPAIQSPSICLNELPNEILRIILRSARAPYYELNPSTRSIPRMDNTWVAELRLRKALILVCKRWSGPAREFFYEDIVLRRTKELFALAHTLAAHQGPHWNLAILVKSIRLEGYVVRGPCADAARDALRSIFSLCTALRTFEYQTAKRFPTLTLPPEDTRSAFNPVWFVDDGFEPFQVAFRRRVSALTGLDLAMPLSQQQVAHLHGLLSTATCLQTLRIGSLQNAEDDEGYLGSLPVLSLSQLKELRMPVNRARLVTYVSTTWEMPRLKRLTTLSTFKVPHELITAHGAHLLYLHLDPRPVSRWIGPSRRRVDIEDIKRLQESCPLLEHLVLPNWWNADHLRSELESSASALRCVDIWSRQITTTGVLNLWLQDRPGSTLLMRSLHLDLGHADLPTICHPKTYLHDSETRTVRFPRLSAVWSKHLIIPDARTGRYNDWSSDSEISKLSDYGPEHEIESGLKGDVEEGPPTSGLRE